jgi:hypothetical protein
MLLILDDGSGCPVARKAGPWARLGARLSARRLDAELAAGASPDASVRLALRAQLLVRTSVRRDLARSAQRILATAAGPHPGPRLPVPVCRDRVRDAAGELAELISGLLSPGPVPARGVAKASILIGDASGPLYHRGSTQDLRAAVRETAEALSPLSGQRQRLPGPRYAGPVLTGPRPTRGRAPARWPRPTSPRTSRSPRRRTRARTGRAPAQPRRARAAAA